MKTTLMTILQLALLLLTATLHSQRDPQWLMPLYFRDANGDRDTVYFGYDPEATTFDDADTILGEHWIIIDTSKFNVFLFQYPSCTGGDCSLYTDTVKKTDIRKSFLGTSIGFCKGKMPVTMKWADSLLYDPTCPFPDLSPRPRARIDLSCYPQEPAYLWCGPADGWPLSLTDYPAPGIPYPVMDSMFFNGSGYYTPAESIGGLTLSLVAHNHTYVDLESAYKGSLKVYPNPLYDFLSVENPTVGSYSVEVLTLTGEVLFRHFSTESKSILNLTRLDSGFYLLFIHSDSITFIQKILKID